MGTVYRHFDRLAFMLGGDIKFGQEVVGRLALVDDKWLLTIDGRTESVSSRIVGMNKAAELWESDQRHDR